MSSEIIRKFVTNPSSVVSNTRYYTDAPPPLADRMKSLITKLQALALTAVKEHSAPNRA